MIGGFGDSVPAAPEGSGSPYPVLALRIALERYADRRTPASLDQGFAAAARAVAELRGERAGAPPALSEVESLFEQLPDYERLVELAVAETERSVQAAGLRLWDWFGLTTSPPSWNAGERGRARLLLACACAPLDEQVAGWLGPRLLRLSADRWAARLTAELREAHEDLWRRVLGDRYESVWQRCAPRGRWSKRELADLLAHDDDVAASMQRQLARWLGDGAHIERLPDELEAAFVHARTPDRLA